MIEFEILAQRGLARRGVIRTAHGNIDTPAFMPVGTQGTVKGMLPGNVASTGAQIVLGNTYHLMLRPGAEKVASLGGLHKFMNWPGPILTDSGGFQVMSLGALRKISEKGVVFRSHIDGTKYELTPERSLEIQHLLDADISMCFDECTPFPATFEVARDSMLLSMRWAQRSKNAFVDRPGYALFGIVQGGIYNELRSESVGKLREIGFDGYAIGGLAVGEGQELMFKCLDFTVPLLPINAPHYLMGVGKPSDIVGSVLRGVDMFDCVMPTRSGRTGQGFTRFGTVNVRNARHANDPRPLDAGCNCPCCQSYSRAYLHHLFKAKEILGVILLTWHNIQHYQDLMLGLRRAILDDCLDEFVKEFEYTQNQGDIEAI